MNTKTNPINMKKILILSAFVLSCGLANAQLDLRAFGGFNILQLTSDNGTSLIDGAQHQRSISGRPGAQFGLAATFGKRFYVQPGVNWGMYTTQEVNTNSTNNTNYEDQTTISTIAVPLRFGVRVIDPETENIFNVRLFGGIVGSHVTSVNHKEKSGKIDDYKKEDFTNMIMSADFGMGIDLAFLFVDAGYHMGLSPVFRGGDNAKANSFYVNAGLRIRL